MNKYFRDLQQSNLINMFLQEHYYPLYSGSFEVVKDKRRQLAGIDVILRDNNKEIYIDEKSTRYYGEDHIPSYFFELELNDKNNNRRVGWFLDENKVTTHYLITWYKYNRYDEIEAAECLLIERKKVLKLYKEFTEGLIECEGMKLSNGPYPECSSLFIVPYPVLKMLAPGSVKFNLRSDGNYVITYW